MRFRIALIALALSAALAASAAAQTPPASPDATAPRAYQVEGFRTAKFGMSEAEVRRAIQIDFGVKESAIGKETNPAELTTVLSITAQDVLPEVGKVRIAYTLGYQRKRLMQVVVAWGAGVSDTSPTATNVLSGAKRLQAYFVSQPFPADSRVVNSQLPGDINLLFQGLDEKGRLVQLQYGLVAWPPQGQKSAAEKPSPLIPFARVVYSEDPQNPDIFRIKPGQF